MTNTDLASRTTVIPPGEPDLATLADQINAAWETLKRSLTSTVAQAVALGVILNNAKTKVIKDLGHGHWLEWQATNIGVPERKAQRCMELAETVAELRAKDPALDISKLTMTGQLRLIEELKDPDDNSGTATRTTSTTRKSPVDKAIERDALAILKKAWRKCNVEQQDAFRQEIG
jgi:hypothetical protein